jgi:ABC-type glutathione transport system ATPase component
MTRPKKKTTPARKTRTNPSDNLRQRVLDDARTLKVPLSAEGLDAALARAEQEGLSHLNFLELIFGEPAARSRQRAIERRIREARFREDKKLEDFDWKFNGQAIDRVQIEQLATGEFLRRHENLVMVGQSGVGKSHLLQALARRYCEQGYLGDPPLAMAFLDRIVDGAILLKIRGKSYRAHRAKKPPAAANADAA